MRKYILSAIAGTALLGTTAIAPAKAAVSADINIRLGSRAPSVYFHREPRVMLIPETEVYYVDDDLGYDMYRCGDWWYIDDGGYWYRSESYRGPYVSISITSLPRRVLNVPIAYRHQPYRSRSWDQGNYGYYGNYGRGQNNGSWQADGRRTYQRDRGARSGDQRWRDGSNNRNWGNNQGDRNWGNNQGDGNGRDQNGRGNSNGNGRGRGHGRGHDRNRGNQ